MNIIYPEKSHGADDNVFLTWMLVTVITVTVLAVSVIVLVMMVVIGFVAVLLLFQAESHGDLVPGRQVEPVLLLQLPPGLVPLCLQLSQGSTDKLLLLEDTKCNVNSNFSVSYI